MRKLMKFDEAAQDREFQRQALRELRATQPDISSKIEMPTKRERESLKSFSKRVKATTRQVPTIVLIFCSIFHLSFSLQLTNIVYCLLL